MSFFLITFFLLYGGIHLYAFLRVRAAVPLGMSWNVGIVLFMVLMTLAPAIIRISERLGFEVFARFFSYAGYLWMGMLFLFCSCSIVIDLYRLLLTLGQFLLRTELSTFKPSVRLMFFIPFIVSMLITAYGYVEALRIRTETVTIKTSKLPAETDKLRMVQISDVHIGLIVREKRIRKILEHVKLARPDILISTGDLVDGQLDRLDGISELFNEIQPTYGKYAITGNHEFYAGLEQATAFTKKAGFTILRGEGTTVAGLLNIAGVDDRTGRYYDNYHDISEKALLRTLENGKFTILLKHRPLVDRDAAGLFDLQLSGHTHKGQIFPFSLVTKLYYPADSGLMNVAGDALLYVSRGTGTWGPPVRFLSPPEVTVIDIQREKNGL
ncbi:MAG: metallophosphoesterase [Nitrospiraceae bacterium]|jgi:predicted MPP superfamily phosphohydrolase|nr:MAG: metallophosphoesterase [Nitrospiraceae bacterium]